MNAPSKTHNVYKAAKHQKAPMLQVVLLQNSLFRFRDDEKMMKLGAFSYRHEVWLWFITKHWEMHYINLLILCSGD